MAKYKTSVHAETELDGELEGAPSHQYEPVQMAISESGSSKVVILWSTQGTRSRLEAIGDAVADGFESLAKALQSGGDTSSGGDDE